jgi:hemoglobin-like flavoprotein
MTALDEPPRSLMVRVPYPDPVSIAVVRATCRRLDRTQPQLAMLFYEHLFAIAPQVRTMFAADLSAQTDRLFGALLTAVDAIEQPETISPLLRRLGYLHQQHHGVTGDMYPYVGHALIRAVRDYSGDWSTLAGSAWSAVYAWLAAEMRLGAEAGSLQ